MLKITIFAAFFVLTVTSQGMYKPCPNRLPIVKCAVPPCKGVRNQVCVESFCGVCKATCYNNNGRKQKCKFVGRTPGRRIQRRLNSKRRNWRNPNRLLRNRIPGRIMN